MAKRIKKVIMATAPLTRITADGKKVVNIDAEESNGSWLGEAGREIRAGRRHDSMGKIVVKIIKE